MHLFIKKTLAALVVTAGLASCATAPAPGAAVGTAPAAEAAPGTQAIPATKPEVLQERPYLGFEDYLPPPPEKNGENYAWKRQADELARAKGVEIRKTARGDLAKYDAESAKTKMREIMISEVLGFEISEKATPAIHRYLYTAVELGFHAVDNTKKKFNRDRPFVSHTDDPTCRPDIRDTLNKHASYPSGHTISAWVAALAASSVMPSRADVITKRMYEAGESRWICGHHWQSDVEAARNLGSSAFAYFVSTPEFAKLYDEARAEADALIAKKNN
ncbi:phosphatase PAP2 family protein [Sutterella sp.]|uniref:phosphatase PAP2 family protein n=1 Tax=Sutterella sp. TaxID=1981025 RepID=UPI0026DF5E90|nr:phosphatase PAP2 family protein [Sutterella sp.]MDO5532048.1 phosphatase PAP2 family protein [Sutterella sp.]